MEKCPESLLPFQRPAFLDAKPAVSLPATQKGAPETKFRSAFLCFDRERLVLTQSIPAMLAKIVLLMNASSSR